MCYNVDLLLISSKHPRHVYTLLSWHIHRYSSENVAGNVVVQCHLFADCGDTNPSRPTLGTTSEK